MYAADNGPIPNGPEQSGRILAPRHALAGLQAGVAGALVLIACLMAGSLWDGRSIWVAPNLFATTFFGVDVYRNHLERASWSGIALLVVVYGVLGAIWGCFWRGERRRWMKLYGAAAGLGVYLLFFDLLSLHVNPLFTLYAPDRQLEVGHVLWGIVLARSPLYARRIAKSTKAPAPQSIPEEEVRSGEVIL